jgi:hypothetical protein
VACGAFAQREEIEFAGDEDGTDLPDQHKRGDDRDILPAGSVH